MEQIFKKLSLFNFQERFKAPEDCLIYLFDFKCKSNHINSCYNRVVYYCQCVSYQYVEPPTVQTLFYQIKFRLLKTFYIAYFISANKEEITYTELSKKLSTPKTYWLLSEQLQKL